VEIVIYSIEHVGGDVEGRKNEKLKERA